MEEYTKVIEKLSNHLEVVDKVIFCAGFEQGTKWQAERMYSEEDINKLLDTLLQNNMCSVAGDELIKQFKKK